MERERLHGKLQRAFSDGRGRLQIYLLWKHAPFRHKGYIEDTRLFTLLRSLLTPLVLICAFMPCHAATLPDTLLGRWQVAEVHTNNNAASKTYYFWNDARLLWRING
jgi:hypothetical protein